MAIIAHIRDLITRPHYDPDQDPLVRERRDIAERTETVLRRFENETHPATGMTLADMAGYRRPWNHTSSHSHPS